MIFCKDLQAAIANTPEMGVSKGGSVPPPPGREMLASAVVILAPKAIHDRVIDAAKPLWRI
jgi:hypothetical protein